MAMAVSMDRLRAMDRDLGMEGSRVMAGSLDIGTGAMIAGAAVPTGRAVRLSADSLVVSSVTTQRTAEIADRPPLPDSSSAESPGMLSPAMAAATTGATGIVIATTNGMMIVTATKGSMRSIQGPKVRKLVRIAHHIDRLNALAGWWPKSSTALMVRFSLGCGFDKS